MGYMSSLARLAELHPAIEAWFTARFADGPTEPQARAWPLVQAGHDVLVAAPTGSGKTLAGFLMALDEAYRAHASGEDITDGTRVVYVSPLKALAVDVRQNLQAPLEEIAAAARALGLQAAPVTVGVRTGDTSASERAALVKKPPTILVTTPESLYLYLTAEKGRATLRRTRTVIVDEIHALARDKRGSHLALSLERLDHAQDGGRPQRLGLSATQRPIETMARLLGGTSATTHACEDGKPASADERWSRHVEIVDCGHQRGIRASIELPGQDLTGVLSQEQLGDIVVRIARHVEAHRTTLVFVNTRRLAERLAHLLGEVLGPEQVAAHHGSLSSERRKRTETLLRDGQLRALVATASLELGIDVGPVDLACQVGSPRAISTFLQRVGRSNHSRFGVPEGILFPTTRDELVECAALLGAVSRGRLDAVVPPVAPLDILAQQLIAEVAAEGQWGEDALFECVRQAAPYGGLRREDFDAVVELASEGIPTGRGARMAFLHRDRVNHVVRPRRGARLAALTSGGAIPEVGDYRVVAEPDDVLVGSVNEDFAIESMPGDVFLLGTHAWRIRRVTAGLVRVSDAQGARPNIPFWTGEAPSRTAELSEEVSDLRVAVAEVLLRCAKRGGSRSRDDPRQCGDGGPVPRAELSGLVDAPCRCEQAAVDLVSTAYGAGEVAARQLVSYLATGLDQLGSMPSQSEIVWERFFDDAGGMQLVVHSPFGGRVNRALGLALRKRFCVTFDFELQAAASDDAVVLSLGPQHSFPLAAAPRLLHPNAVRSTVEQAVLASPMFTSRWRWDLSRALAILRYRGGKKNPLPVQRMEADDLMAAVFPALAACQENTPPGPVELPDHVLVRQVLDDCLHEAMDIEGLLALVTGLHDGTVRARFVEAAEPSVLSHEIVNSKPYTFLDDAPLEERRARQVQVRHGLPSEVKDLSRVDPEALQRVRAEAAPAPRDAEELHELLLSTVLQRPREHWEAWFESLVAAGRAVRVELDGQPDEVLWCATERRSWVEAGFRGVAFHPDHRLDGSAFGSGGAADPDQVAALVLRGHLECSGPVTAASLAAGCCMTESRALVGLARLEAEGSAVQGQFDPALGNQVQWCARHLLSRAHSYSQSRARRQLKPVSTQELVRFLIQWQHVAPGALRQGRAGLLSVIDQLQGCELAAGAWEESVLPARVENYQRQWLEDLCLSGDITWGRLSLRPADRDGGNRRGAASPSRATPVTFALRSDLDWLLQAKRGPSTPEEPAHGPAREVLDALREHGAMFAPDLCAATGRMPTEIQEGLWDLVSRGLVTADTFGAVRSLFASREAWARRHMPERRRLGQRAGPGARRAGSRGGGGRWAVLGSDKSRHTLLEAPDGARAHEGTRLAASPGRQPGPGPVPADDLAELVATQLLARWGIVFWDLASREALAVPWREILWALRRFEARGLVRGGRFVTGPSGEQYALPEALEALGRASRKEGKGETVRLCAADPLNLSGLVMAGKRVPALRTTHIVLRDGLLVPANGGGSGLGPGAGSGPSAPGEPGASTGRAPAPAPA